jgi:hypothetical protein
MRGLRLTKSVSVAVVKNRLLAASYRSKLKHHSIPKKLKNRYLFLCTSHDFEPKIRGLLDGGKVRKVVI